jgi:type I restriction enzyme, S subunit
MAGGEFGDLWQRLTNVDVNVESLRQTVLHLAVTGRLGTQNTADEPASELLRRIRTGRQQLLDNGQARRLPRADGLPEEALARQLPATWAVTRLVELSRRIHYGHTASADSSIRQVRMLRITDIQNNQVNWEMVPGCKVEKEKLEACLLHEGDLLIARTGGTIGKSYLVKRQPACAIFASYLIRVVPCQHICPAFLKVFADSPTYWDQLRAASAGTGQPNVNSRSLGALIVPLPPLLEQERIVAKVDELMSLCDEMESHQQRRREVRVHLNDAALDRLVTASGPAEFAAAWQRVRDNFGLLYAVPENVAKLRQAIRQLAVQGKLVAQDPNEEPAAQLLTTLKQLGNGRLGIGDPSHSERPTGAERPLPPGWAWIELGQFGEFCGGGTPSKRDSSFWKGSIPWVSPKDMKAAYITDSMDHLSKSGLDNSSAKLIPPPALLMVVRGMILAHSFPVALSRRELTINQDMKALKLFLPETGEYLLRACAALKSQVLKRVERSTHGTCRLSMAHLARLLVPVPPLAEQQRIVSRVDYLLGLCDVLEGSLRTKCDQANRLAQAVANGVVNGKMGKESV